MPLVEATCDVIAAEELAIGLVVGILPVNEKFPAAVSWLQFDCHQYRGFNTLTANERHGFEKNKEMQNTYDNERPKLHTEGMQREILRARPAMPSELGPCYI